MSYKNFGLIPLAGLALIMMQAGTVTETLAAACPAVTVAKDMGISGKYRQQFELAEFEKLANCKLSFNENPAIGKLNGRIRGNPLDRAGPRGKYHEGRVRTRLSTNLVSDDHRRWRPERALR